MASDKEVVAAGCGALLLYLALVLGFIGAAAWLVTHIIVSAVS